MAAVVFPIDRVINIRRAQGALPRYRYTSVLNCLYKMPREQGGFRHVWRGVGPHLAALNFTMPLKMLVHWMLGTAPLLQESSSDPVPIKLLKSSGQGAAAGACASLLIHPLEMASLRMQLDLGGGPWTTLAAAGDFQQ